MHPMALQGTVGLNALITGASGGIGSAIALAFAERGIDLALHYSTTRPDKLLLIIRERFPDVTVKLFQADISTTASCIDLGTRVLDFFKQKCDIFISNAGVARFALDSRPDCAQIVQAYLLSSSLGYPLRCI